MSKSDAMCLSKTYERKLRGFLTCESTIFSHAFSYCLAVTAALSWPGGQSKDCIRSHAPVRRYPPFRPPTHRPRPLRYQNYVHNARDNVETYSTFFTSANGTCEVRAITPSFFMEKNKQARTGYPGTPTQFLPKLTRTSTKDRQPSFPAPPVRASTELDCSTPPLQPLPV